LEVGSLLKISSTGETRELTGEKAGTSRVFNLETKDHLRAEVELREFTDESKEIRLTNFLAPPPPKYEHLNRNGSMPIQAQSDGTWVVLMRALRLGGKPYPTLNEVTWAELSELTEMDFEKHLLEIGLKTGTWQELNVRAKKYKDSLAAAAPQGQSELLLVPWAVTRVIALMKRLGKPGLEVN
jgi:hypothetical protein